ncbi:beta strand repeat-containing protein, partial [Candidatus Omnitrophota bacterium]
MADGALIDAGIGTISLSADENITLGGLKSTNAGTVVTLTTSEGEIVDGGDTHLDVDAANGTLVIDAAAGVGAADAIDTKVAKLDIDNSTSGNIDINETDALSINNITQATAGNINVDAAESITVVAGQSGVTAAGTGSIMLDANGATSDLIIYDAITSASGDIILEADDVVLFLADGDITSTSGNVSVIADADNGGAASGALTMVDGALIDAGTGTISLSADENITLGGLKTTNASGTAVTLTTSEGRIIDGGDAHLDVDAANGTLVIDAVTGVGTSGDIETKVAAIDIDNSTSGNIKINETDDLNINKIAQATTGDINVDAAGTITVVAGQSGVTAASTSSIILDANGATSDLIINATIQGVSTLEADNDVTFGVDGYLTSIGYTISVTADADNGGAASGALTMADGALIDAGTGAISLSADENITLGGLKTTGTSATAVTLTTSEGAIIDGGDTHLDVDAANGTLVIDAAAGVGAANAIDTKVAKLDIDNSTSGNIDINETDDLSINKIAQATAGNINVDAAGSITVVASQSGVSAVGAGTIELDANGATSDLIIYDAITSASGDIILEADDVVLFLADSDITSTSGNVSVIADADNGGAASGALTMVDGALIDAGTGTISLSADENITLGGLKTTNASGTAVTLTTSEGRIIDGGDAHLDVDAANGTLVIDAVTGVGTSGDIETKVAAIDIDNSTSGNIKINETDDLNINKIAQATAGNINVDAAGTITVVAAQSGVSAVGTGTIDLDANGATSDLITNDAITSVSGTITLEADNDVTFGADGDVTSTSGDVVVSADDNGDASGTGGALTMADGTLINAGIGTIALTSDEDITLGGLLTTNATAAAVTLTTSSGAIVDGGVTHVDVVASSGRLVINAATGIDVDTTISSLDASVTAAGSITLDETNDITLTDVDTADGAITITAGGAITATDVAAAGSGDEDDVTIVAQAGDVTLGVVSAAGSGDVTIEATTGSINDASDDTVTDITGDVVTLTAANEIGGDAPAALNDDRGAIEVSSTSLDVSVTAGDIVLTESDGTELTDIDTAGAIDIVSTTGDLTIGDTDATGAVTLVATAGSINDAADDLIDDITGTTVTLTAANEIGGDAPAALNDDRDAIEVSSTSLDVSVTAGDI